MRYLMVIIMVGLSLSVGFGAIQAEPSPQHDRVLIPDGTLRRIHVPVLMYHYISQLPENPDQYRPGLTVEPDIFRSHLEYLRDAGYTTISLYQLHEALTIGAPLPPRPIILTFDDGHLDHYVTVFPLLQEFGFTGTFFIITGFADSGNPVHLNWAQIQEMAEAGMSMEAHTKTHQNLRERDWDFLVYEMLGSIESLEAHTETPVHMLAYPAGSYDEATLAVASQLPIWRAVTTEQGAYHTTDNMLEVKRLRVTGNMGVLGLEQLIRRSF